MGWAVEAAAEDFGGAAVGFAYPGGVDAQGGGSASAVAEVAGDGTQVDAGGQQLGGGVVAQGVQVAGDAEFGAHVHVAVADRGGVERLAGVRLVGEQVRVLRGLQGGGASLVLVARRWAARTSTVAVSRAMRRIWWILVSFSIAWPCSQT